MKKNITSLLLSFTIAAVAQAQTPVGPPIMQPGAQKKAPDMIKTKPANPHGIRILADGQGDSIRLRWAPTSPFVWQMGNKYGYIIERFIIKEDSVFVSAKTKKQKTLTAIPLMPYSRARFDSLEQTDERTAIVREAIYGDEFKLEASMTGSSGRLNKRHEVDNRFGFALLMCDLSPVAAKAAALSFTDTATRSNTRYIYRIKLGKPIPNLTYDPGVVVVDGKEAFQPVQINDLTGSFADQTATLKWAVDLHQGVYSAYVIEKSDDGQHFHPVTDDPLITTSKQNFQDHAFYVDSLVNNTQQFYYRIKGITPFGVTGPASNIFAGKGKDELAPLTIVDSAQVLKDGKVKIAWHLDNPKQRPVKGFYVLKAAKDEGPYLELNKEILPANVFSFTDPSPARSNYYRVRTIMGDSDISLSFSRLALLIDSLPPVHPAGLAGLVDSTGGVLLRWVPNKEDDLLGYRVFRSNSNREEYVEVTSNILARASFRDTININTLTSKVYYKVIAIDQNFNASAYSPPLELKRPDTIAPAPPVFGQVRRADTTIRLSWIPGHGEDMAKQVLYRQRKEADSAEKIAEWPAGRIPSEFTDRTGLQNGAVYVYRLEAHDSSGNISKTLSGEVFYETGIRKPIDQVTAKAEREKRLINLEWKYTESNIRKIIVYRNKQGEPATIYQTLNENPGSFEDKELTINNTYVYQIQAVFQGGARSPISKQLVVKY